MFQNRQVMVNSLGYCWYSGGPTQRLDSWSSCNVRGKIGVGEIEDGRGIVIENECVVGMQNQVRKVVFCSLGQVFWFVW